MAGDLSHLRNAIWLRELIKVFVLTACKETFMREGILFMDRRFGNGI